MFSKSLAKFTSKLPSSIKYRLGKYKGVYTRFMALGESITQIQTQAGQLNWKIDSLTSQTFLLGTYEPYMQKAFVELIRPGFTVYDVGAHAGFHTLFCGLLVGETGRVVGFEPVAENRASIERQLMINPKIPVTLSPYALSNHCGKLAFDTTHSTSQGSVSEKGNITVEAKTIDSLIDESQIPPPRLIKIDVEGHELQVLEGAAQTISKYKPLILCDYNDHQTLPSIESFLRPYSYNVTPGPPIIATYRTKELL